MSMAEKDIVNRAKDEMAASGDNIPPQEPRIYESGYFFLSQQINDLRDRMDAKFDKVDTKFDSMRKEIDARFDKVDAKFDVVYKEIKALSDKTDARFDKVDDKFDGIHREISGLQKWAFALIVTVVLGFVAVYFK